MNPIRRFSWLLALVLTARAAEARTDVTGTWTGTLPVDGIDRLAVIQLHQRGDGSVLGYLLGGTSVPRPIAEPSRAADTRTGTPRSGGPVVTYHDTVTDAAHSELMHLRVEAGVWRIAGNQSGPLDLPFAFATGVLAVSL
jgi:hypothetical protein